VQHGTDAYFDGRRRNARRLSSLSVIVGLALLAPLLLLRTTPLGTRLRELRVMRFGFAGPPRYVELMQIDARPTDFTQPRDVGRVVTRSSGGASDRPSAAAPRRGKVARGSAPLGVFDEPGNDLVARAIASRGQVPVMQSSELVIDVLVRPVYPEEARRQGIEGHVAVLARVDTLGRVAEAQVMNPSGDSDLDESSLVAVRQCRFRPYREQGKPAEVYAVFRFAFRIY
jgi:TonB family protein